LNFRKISSLYPKADKGLLFLCIIFVLSLPLLTPRIYSSDEIEYYVYLRSLYKDGDLDFRNDYETFASKAPEEYKKSGFHHTFLELETATGLRNNFAPVGCSVLWLPWFVAADIYVNVVNFFGGDILTDGFSAPYIQMIAYGSMTYGFLALIFIYLTLRRFFKPPVPLISTLTVWLATPAVYYMYVQAPMSHACSMFIVSLFVWYWSGTLGSLKISRWIILGLLIGAAGIVREQDIFFGILLPVELAGQLYYSIHAKKHFPLRETILRVFAALGACTLVFIPQLIAYKVLYGHYGPSPLVARKMMWASPYSWEVLFNYSHGLFFWTPVVIFAVAGLIFFAVKNRFIGLSLLAAFLMQVYVSGAVGSWHASGSFGLRRFVGCSIVFAFGLAFLFSILWEKRRKLTALLLAGIFCLWNLQLIVQFATGMIDRSRLDIIRSAKIAVTVLPEKIVHIGGKFFTDRDDLYKIKDKKIRRKNGTSTPLQ
jgi:hypothetical protein